MYPPGKAVKIVKREQREVDGAEAAPDLKTASQARDEMIQKVSRWIAERRVGQALQRRQAYALLESIEAAE